MNLTKRIITSKQSFFELEEEWEKFRCLQNADSFCNSGLWLNTWCNHYLQKKDKLTIYCFYVVDQLVGVAPLYLKKIACGYQLMLLATGEDEDGEICSEFQDLICLAQYEEKMLLALSQCIKSDASIISIKFSNVFPDSLIQRWFYSHCQHWTREVDVVGLHFIAPVGKDIDDQIELLTSKTTKRHAKKYVKATDCYCEVLSDETEIPEYFEELTALHNLSWQERGKLGVFINKTFSAFHREFTKKLFQKNKLLLFKIICQQKTVAVFYGIIEGDVLYYYQSGVMRDCALPSAGTAMHIEALNYARKNQLKSYDLMKGSPDSYKAHFIPSEKKLLNSAAFKKSFFWLPYYLKLKIKLNKAITFK
jgi:hypothetical protein